MSLTTIQQGRCGWQGFGRRYLGMTPGIIATVANVAEHSLTSYRDRDEATQNDRVAQAFLKAHAKSKKTVEKVKGGRNHESL